MKDYSLLKISKKELFIIAGYNENYSVYRSFLEAQKKHQDEINYKENIMNHFPIDMRLQQKQGCQAPEISCADLNCDQ